MNVFYRGFNVHHIVTVTDQTDKDEEYRKKWPTQVELSHGKTWGSAETPHAFRVGVNAIYGQIEEERHRIADHREYIKAEIAELTATKVAIESALAAIRNESDVSELIALVLPYVKSNRRYMVRAEKQAVLDCIDRIRNGAKP